MSIRERDGQDSGWGVEAGIAVETGVHGCSAWDSEGWGGGIRMAMGGGESLDVSRGCMTSGMRTDLCDGLR